MADGPAGFHFDELNKVRVLEPEISQQTQELKEECKEFVDKIGEFQKIVGGFIDMVDALAKEVEKEKMKAIGSRNLLKSIAKQREAQQQQLRALIAEKKTQLERQPKLKPGKYAIKLTCPADDSGEKRIWIPGIQWSKCPMCMRLHQRRKFYHQASFLK